MGATSYLFNDYIKDITAGNISITNEDANFPTENSQNEKVSLCTRTTAIVGIKYRFELAANKALQIFSINNHNFSGGTFDINQYNAGWAGGAAVQANVPVRLLDVYHREASAPAAKKLWEFDLTNVTTDDTHFEFGRAMAYDDLVQLSEVEDYERKRAYGYRNIINETTFGVRWAHKLYENREEFELFWKARDRQNLPAELRTLFEAIYGDAHPFLFIPDLANTDCYYVFSMTDKLEWGELFGTAATDVVTGFNLPLIEEVRGKV